MSKPKAQGTAWESWLVGDLRFHGLDAWRLAEGGSADAGDIAAVDRDGDHIIIEAKATERLNATRALAKAKAKTAQADLPFVPWATVLAWKRIVKGDGPNRVADGERRVVVMDWETFLELIA